MTIKRYDKKIRQTVTLPDGKKATRLSDRVYTHVFTIRREGQPGWGVVSWHGRVDLAEKKRDAYDIISSAETAIVKVNPIEVPNAPLLTHDQLMALMTAVTKANDAELRHGLQMFVTTLRNHGSLGSMTAQEAVVSAITALTQKIEGAIDV